MKMIASACGTLLISGCSLFEPVTKPSEVTLEQALASVGSGLKVMHEAEKGTKTGLIASEVTVTFAIAASKDVAGKLTVDLSKTLSGGDVSSTSTQGGSLEAKSVQSRSNNITVKFINLMMIPKETLAYQKSASELIQVMQAPETAGWTVFVAPASPLTVPPPALPSH